MKEEYVKPTMEAIEIENIDMFASSTIDINNGTQGDSPEDFTPRKRGTWGNLWE